MRKKDKFSVDPVALERLLGKQFAGSPPPRPVFWTHLWSAVKYPFSLVRWLISNKRNAAVIRRWKQLAGIGEKPDRAPFYSLQPEKVGTIEYPGDARTQQLRPGGEKFPLRAVPPTSDLFADDDDESN